MERKSMKWPWITALIVCASIFLVSVAFTVIRLLPDNTPENTDHAKLQFEKLFADPNWAEIYALTEVEDNPFEDANTVAAYMQAKVGEKLLTYQEVYTNIPDTHRYIVSCDGEKIAAFHMLDADWSLTDLDLLLDHSVSVKVETPADVLVFVNGIALDESYLAYTMHTKAEKYLPEGVHGVRMHAYMVRDLLMQPTVTAMDLAGNAVPLSYDKVTDVYFVQTGAPAEITEAQKEFVGGAATADAMYALARISNKELATYIDSNSDLYKMLTENPRNLQKFTSATVEDVVVSDFCRYSDTFFSANVKLTQKIIRSSGTLKTYYLDKTYFFKLNDDGEYRVVAYTNEHVTDKVEAVKVTFITPTDEISHMVDINATSVSVPDMSEYSGFCGWATQTQYEENEVLIHVRILPDGTVLGGLEPMVLYPLFPHE